MQNNWWIWVLVALAVAGVLYFQYRARQKKVAALRALADRRGWRFAERDDSYAEKFAYDVLHPRTMQWMLDDHRFTEQPFRFENGNLIAWRDGKMRVEQVDGMLDFLCDIVGRVPEFVWK